MKGAKEVLNFILLINFFIQTCQFSAKCNSQDECYCFESENSLKLHCPHINDDFTIEINADSIKIDCPETLEELNYSLFPNVSVGKVQELQIRYCPWPLQPFKKVLEHFNLSSIFEIHYSSHSNGNVSLDAEIFKGLENVTKLRIDSNNIIKIDESVFDKTPSLSYLELNDNQLMELKKNQFNNLNYLQHLDLSSNKLKKLPDKVFSPLKNLTFLHLWDNSLEDINEFLFEKLDNLIYLSLSYNNLRSISDSAFINLVNLQHINLAYNKLEKISRELFQNKPRLSTIWIRNNPGLVLQDSLFVNLTIEDVDLSKCGLRELPENLFRGSTNLKVLNLGGNDLKIIPADFFQELFNLRKIYLQNNRIKNLDGKLLSNLYNLRQLDLGKNELSSIYLELPNLENVQLSKNHIIIVDELVSYKRTPKLKSIDLSHNNITNFKVATLNLFSGFFLNLDNNFISSVDFSNVSSSFPQKKIVLTNNPLICNCTNHLLLQHIQNYNNVEINSKQCKSLESSVCALQNEICPAKWCWTNQTLIFNCSYQNMTEYPEIKCPDGINFNQSEINLEGNILRKGPPRTQFYKNVTRLYLGKNLIEELTWIPPKIQVLELQDNVLRTLPVKLLKKMENLVKLNLKGNLWKCDCDSINLSDFLRKFKFGEDVTCENSDVRLIHLKNEEPCLHLRLLQITIVVFVGFLLCLLLLLWITISLYMENIKICLYSKGMCPRFMDFDEVEDKMYDVFISYAQEDEDLVVTQLLPFLESLEYRICLQDRDWLPGELLNSQIINSIEESSKTIVVLSEKYLENMWKREELRMAYSFTILERKSKLIVIVTDDLNFGDLDGEMEMYLRLNTYLKRSDPYFLEKLKYALPRRSLYRRREQENTRISEVNLLHKTYC